MGDPVPFGLFYWKVGQVFKFLTGPEDGSSSYLASVLTRSVSEGSVRVTA